MATQQQIITALKKVSFPGKEGNIVDLGMLKAVEIEENGTINCRIEIEDLESPFKRAFRETCKDAIHRLADTDANVEIELVAPPVDPSTIIGGVGKVKSFIAVVSGKGGVGKSTVTVNLAVSLANKGYKVGLIDADIFGPSVPKMFGVEDERPAMKEVSGKGLIIPVEKFGVKMLSMGFFVQSGQATPWRGPVASGALKQMITDGDWGELDVLLFDMPPGTSDIHLTAVQTVALTGSVIVSTPQDVALIDAEKAIDMFRMDKVQVPILGLVENMSWFTPEELPDNKYYIFGKGGGERICAERDIPFLGNVPIVQKIREGGDEGEPVAYAESSVLKSTFDAIADKVVANLNERNELLPPTETVKVKH